MKSKVLSKSAIADGAKMAETRTLLGTVARHAVGRGARGRSAIDDADNDYLRWWQRRAETPAAPMPVVIRVPKIAWCPQGWHR